MARTDPRSGPSPVFPPARRLARRARAAALLGAALSLLGVGCSKTPITERAQFNLIPDAVMLPLGRSAYAEMLAGARLHRKTAEQATLSAVGKRISRVAQKPEYQWQFKMIEDDRTVNAWCLPGGKIAFYTGILPVLKNEAGMAFVMGHEVAHATARHGSERMSQQLALLGGLGALHLYMHRKTELNDLQMRLIRGALGVGATVGYVLPFSRKHEKEADIIGMMYMARAGYPPEESVAVWERMKAETGRSAVPAFISTHPTHAERQQNLKAWMDQAQKRYARNRISADTRKELW